MMKPRSALVLAALVAASGLAAAQAPEVTPYRPSVSNPARLSSGIVGIISAELGNYEANLNVGAVRLGQAAEGEGRSELGWALEVGRGLGRDWSVAMEISGAARKGVKGTAELLAAAAYKLSRRLVLDAGVSRSLDEARQWTAFAGFSLLLAGD